MDKFSFAEAIAEKIMEMNEGTEAVAIHTTKNNSVELAGISIGKEGDRIRPTVYVDEIFKQFSGGKADADIDEDDVEKAAEAVMEQTDRFPSDEPLDGFDIEDIADFSKVKDRICFKLVNTGKNAEMLKGAPHRHWNDLAITYYILFSTKGCNASMQIMKSHMEMWGTSEEELYDIAMKNTPRLLPVKIMALGNMLEQLTGEAAFVHDVQMMEVNNYLTICTNEGMQYGAVALLYDGVISQLSGRTGGDFFILPCSINETLIVPTEGVDFETLEKMVREVNATMLSDQEILSDNVYVYSSEDGSINVA